MLTDISGYKTVRKEEQRMRQCNLCGEKCVFYDAEPDVWEGFCHGIGRNIKSDVVEILDNPELWRKQKLPGILKEVA